MIFGKNSKVAFLPKHIRTHLGDNICENFEVDRSIASGGSRFQEKILIFSDGLRSSIFYEIRVEGHNGRLLATFQPFISNAASTKCIVELPSYP